MGVHIFADARRFVAAVAGLALCAAALAGCDIRGEEQEEITDVDVTGEFGAAPNLAFETPLVVDDPSLEIIWTGDGPRVEPGSTVLLNLYGQDGRDGSQIINTFLELPESFKVTAKDLSKPIYDAVVGQQAGARVLVLDQDDGVPVAVVLDILAGRATGDEVAREKGMPTVKLGKAGSPKITVPQDKLKKPPAELQVHPLIRGRGQQVRPGQTVIVQYTAMTWSKGQIIDSTWSKGRTPFTTIVGDSRPIPAWDEALTEQTVGSQVLVVSPPSMSYGGSDLEWGDETIVWVIDILYAGSIAPPEKKASDKSGDDGPSVDDIENSANE